MSLQGGVIDVDEWDTNSDPTCQLCSVSLANMLLHERETHYDLHFRSDNETPNASISSPTAGPSRVKAKLKVHKQTVRSFARDVFGGGSPPSSSTSAITSHNHKSPPVSQNIFWHCSMATDPPGNYTPGLLPVLRRSLLKLHETGAIQRATLCYDGMVHVATEGWDMGWGCGYRNFLMACSALADQSLQPHYQSLLEDPLPPGVRNLQYWIESAWDEGFDKDGARQLKHKLVNTKKWIGTAELYVAFISRGIPVQLVDFPKSNHGPKALIEWVVRYFNPAGQCNSTSVNEVLKGASPVVCTDRMPLILQHQGHSRTIVGYHVSRSGEANLLIFDPSKKPFKELRSAALTSNSYNITNSPSKRERLSPTKASSVFHRILNSASVKRKRSLDECSDTAQVKRVRGGLQMSSKVTETCNLNVQDALRNVDKFLDPGKTVKFFSLNQSRVGKNDQYQILWFPLTAPLSESDKRAHRIVKSERIMSIST